MNAAGGEEARTGEEGHAKTTLHELGAAALFGLWHLFTMRNTQVRPSCKRCHAQL
jgi:hypothetical protein